MIEDAAQGLMSTYAGRPLGGIGHMAALSFHETKNIISGEGGALLLNDPRFVERAEIIWEKGTNRSQFFRGQVDKYTWVDLGSSYLPGEVIAAFLWAQTRAGRRDHRSTPRDVGQRTTRPSRTSRRPAGCGGRSSRTDCEHNAHMYYLLLPNLEARTAFIARLEVEERPGGLPLRAAARLAVRALGRTRCRRHDATRIRSASGWSGCRCGSVSRTRSSGSSPR